MNLFEILFINKKLVAEPKVVPQKGVLSFEELLARFDQKEPAALQKGVIDTKGAPKTLFSKSFSSKVKQEPSPIHSSSSQELLQALPQGAQKDTKAPFQTVAHPTKELKAEPTRTLAPQPRKTLQPSAPQSTKMSHSKRLESTMAQPKERQAALSSERQSVLSSATSHPATPKPTASWAIRSQVALAQTTKREVSFTRASSLQSAQTDYSQNSIELPKKDSIQNRKDSTQRGKLFEVSPSLVHPQTAFGVPSETKPLKPKQKDALQTASQPFESKIFKSSQTKSKKVSQTEQLPTEPQKPLSNRMPKASKKGFQNLSSSTKPLELPKPKASFYPTGQEFQNTQGPQPSSQPLYYVPEQLLAQPNQTFTQPPPLQGYKRSFDIKFVPKTSKSHPKELFIQQPFVQTQQPLAHMLQTTHTAPRKKIDTPSTKEPASLSQTFLQPLVKEVKEIKEDISPSLPLEHPQSIEPPQLKVATTPKESVAFLEEPPQKEQELTDTHSEVVSSSEEFEERLQHQRIDHRVIRLQIEDTRINISYAHNRLNLTFISQQNLQMGQEIEQFVHEVMQESGFERYRVALKDREKDMKVESKREALRRSGVDVKV